MCPNGMTGLCKARLIQSYIEGTFTNAGLISGYSHWTEPAPSGDSPQASSYAKAVQFDGILA
jgi:hypothetical protein